MLIPDAGYDEDGKHCRKYAGEGKCIKEGPTRGQTSLKSIRSKRKRKKTVSRTDRDSLRPSLQSNDSKASKVADAYDFVGELEEQPSRISKQNHS
mmetsp:Transcript_109810/g.266985  ORF Transcript_109810/g.266985 Transcript_109810/m.266985 type:complete len:95 (-) Transcript_109810:238-522(-)